jgi:hypothetical protein
VKSCPTFDNIFIEIEVGAVFRCKDDQKSIEQFVYNISINQLNKQIKAAITERIRVLGKKLIINVTIISSWKDLSRSQLNQG